MWTYSILTNRTSQAIWNKKMWLLRPNHCHQVEASLQNPRQWLSSCHEDKEIPIHCSYKHDSSFSDQHAQLHFEHVLPWAFWSKCAVPFIVFQNIVYIYHWTALKPSKKETYNRRGSSNVTNRTAQIGHTSQVNHQVLGNCGSILVCRSVNSIRLCTGSCQSHSLRLFWFCLASTIWTIIWWLV